MSAPLVWIFLPIVVGGISLIFLNQRTVAILGGVTSLLLAATALLVPIDEAIRIGPLSLKISSTASLLGRSLVLTPVQAPLLVIIFGVCALWFFGAEPAGVALRLIPSGLIITGLLVGAIAVQPFLFAALLIEMAVLVAVPLLSPQEQRPGRGAIRFLIYQTLGMPFILFAGWLLAGVEASPGDLALTIQSTTMLGLGFAFLLAIFPLYNWIPEVMQESSPYVTGFLLWLLPTIVSIFGLSFLDRYAWLRTSPQTLAGLRAIGLLMLVSGGVWAAFQRHFGRLMGYTAVAETGFVLLALGLTVGTSLDLFFLLMIPRAVGLAIWSLALSILKADDRRLRFASRQGLARSYPFATAGLILATLSTAGFPLLAGFAPRLGIWEGLARVSMGEALWVLIGILGLLIGAVRMLAVLVMEKEATPWKSKETLIQRSMLGAGLIALFIMGIFPQLTQPLLEKLPLMFTHLSH
jgi:NADH-quinone oxidoreductase subunit N